MADGLLVPDYRFNDRMVGFRPTTLAAFLDQWVDPERPRHARGKTAKTRLATVARANRTRTSQLLLAAQDANVFFIRDRGRRGLAALSVADRDVDKLLDAARSADLTANACGAPSTQIASDHRARSGMAE